jgi:hypothetical protein
MISSPTEERDEEEGREETSTQESTGRVSAYMLEAVLICEFMLSEVNKKAVQMWLKECAASVRLFKVIEARQQVQGRSILTTYGKDEV